MILAQIIRAALAALGRELAAWKLSAVRAMFGARAVLAVALAVVLAYELQLTNTWWAAISAFVVAQTSWADSLHRSVQRVLGTVLGAACGTILGPWIGDRPWLFIPVLGLIGGATVYRANRSATPYAWLLSGITALMVTYEAHLLGSISSTATFAMTRIEEVAVGTFACVVVSSAFDLARRWRPRVQQSAVETAIQDAEVVGPGGPVASLSPDLLTRASTALGVQAALAMAILAALTYALNLPGLMQGMVTVVAVLVLPESALAVIGRRPVVEKMTHRFIGCLLAGALGLALLPLMRGEAVPCMIVLSLGIWVGCQVQTGQQGATYIGRQFTIAFIMVFVQDHGWSANAGPALTRLAGILIGILVLAAAMLATRRLGGAR